MAEGGENEDNPFSFRSFVKNKTNENLAREAGGDSDPAPSGEPETAEGGASAQRDQNVSEKATAAADRDKKEDENPFSFKKFLRTGGARPKTTGNISTFDLASDLPDFVQDHFTSDSGPRRHHHHHRNPDVPLPDFALDSSPPQSSGQAGSAYLTDNDPLTDHNDFPNVNHAAGIDEVIHSNGASAGAGSFPGLDLEPPLVGANVGSRTPPSIDLDSNFVPIPHLDPTGLGSDSPPLAEPVLDNVGAASSSSGVRVLPDFLSDSAVNSVDARAANQHPGSPASLSDEFPCHNGDLDIELRRLREENRELRRQLDEARQFADTESKRVAKVLMEMESIQKREADETAALENMVQRVEANLQTTTQRALKAEGTISRLKQELKASQSEVHSLRAENRSLRASGATPRVDPVREKAKYASEQINAAAKNAEQMLKQLMTGVDNLKLISDVLASVDKITEEAGSGWAPDPNRATGSDEADLEGAVGGAPT